MSKKLINKARGLSDKAIAWIFITPTVLLLLAINIYPLFYAISMSFTNFYANKIGKEIKWVGLKNYIKVLGKESVWERMQITANFMFWTLLIQALIGLGLALLLNKKFKGNELLTTLIVLPMMLSPAVVGTFWTYLYNPQVGVFSYIMNFFYNFGPIDMIGSSVLAPWSIVIVDTWMWTPFTMLICLAGLRSIPDYLYEAAEVDRASRWQQFIYITLPSVLPFLLLALLFRGIENFKMFDMVVELTSGGPGSTTELASIQLKREAFEKWKTGYSSAYAVILFGFGNVYVKVMNKIKDR